MEQPRQAALAKELRRNQTVPEKLLWGQLQRSQLSGVKFRRQEPVGAYSVDFVSFERQLIIGLDGSQHSEQAERVKDERRTAWLESQGFRVLRYWGHDVLKNLEGVLLSIQAALAEQAPSLRPPQADGPLPSRERI